MGVRGVRLCSEFLFIYISYTPIPMHAPSAYPCMPERIRAHTRAHTRAHPSAYARTPNYWYLY